MKLIDQRRAHRLLRERNKQDTGAGFDQADGGVFCKAVSGPHRGGQGDFAAIFDSHVVCRFHNAIVAREASSQEPFPHHARAAAGSSADCVSNVWSSAATRLSDIQACVDGALSLFLEPNLFRDRIAVLQFVGGVRWTIERDSLSTSPASWRFR